MDETWNQEVFVKATIGDLATVLGLVEAYYSFDRIPFHLPRVRRALEVLLRDTSLGQVWLIRIDHKDVGYVIFTFGYDLEFGGRQATVTDLYIADEYRGLGLGMSTLKAIETTCRELGVTALELQVESSNKAAQAFYRKAGFDSHDRIPMSKPLFNE